METNSSEPSAHARPKVLVVDDEETITDTLRLILERNGFDVATAYSGTTAVEASRLWKPDIFLSDVVMPEMNGVEAAIRIRAALPRCKIVLFSGQAVVPDVVDEGTLEAYGFELLSKPLHPTELIARLQARHSAAESGAEDATTLAR